LQRKRREIPEPLRNFFDLWNEDGWDLPGNYNWDPLNFKKTFCGNDKQKKLFMQTVEVFNGRVAMLAVVGFVAQEILTGKLLSIGMRNIKRLMTVSILPCCNSSYY
jgi:hypothetical protein